MIGSTVAQVGLVTIDQKADAGARATGARETSGAQGARHYVFLMIASTTVAQVGLVTIDQMKQTQERALLEREKQLARRERDKMKVEREKIKIKGIKWDFLLIDFFLNA
jgi:hypothetical protein